MGDLNLFTEVQPNAPSSGILIYSDTNDNQRVKAIHANGTLDFLSENQSYNYLINGGMDFVRRFPTALTLNTQSTTGRQMNADQWGLTAMAASCSYGRIDSLSTPITGSVSRYYGQYKQITNPGKIMISQFLEFKDTANLRGKTVRFQIKVATGAWASGSALRMGLIQNTVAATPDTIATTFISTAGSNSVDPTLGSNLAYVAPLTTGLDGATLTGAAGANALQVANPGANATFVRFSGLFVVPANCVNIGVAIWTDSQISANDVLNIAEAQLIVGQGINDWNPLSYEQELERCYRPYENSFTLDTAPAQNVGANTGEMKFNATLTTTGAARSPSVQLAVPKRIAITSGQVTFFNPSASNANLRDETAAGDGGACTFVAGSDRNFAITSTGNASTAIGNVLGFHWAVDQAI